MKNNVVIIGGGVAGMEAARQLLLLQYCPIIIEKEDHLGGHVEKWHQLFPDLSSGSDLIRQMADSITGAKVYKETRVKSVNRLSDGYVVTLSSGECLNCRAILIASGFRLFDAALKEEYGYGVYNHVISNADLEAWLKGVQDCRIPEAPKSIGFVHCVGSRDLKSGNSQCSKICCMTAIKQAIAMKKIFPESRIFCFYMDLRLFGKKYEDFYIRAQQDYQVNFIRGRVSEVGETQDGRLQIKAEDTLVGKPLKVELDLLVLMSGAVYNPLGMNIAQMVRLEIDSDGFFKSQDNTSRVIFSNQKGIFFAGACTGPKTIPESLAEAGSAALEIHRYLQEQ